LKVVLREVGHESALSVFDERIDPDQLDTDADWLLSGALW
jgi:hypothetical protein